MVDTMSAFTRQSKAARELLGWTQDDLAAKSGLSISTIRAYERGRQTIGTTAAIRATFEKAGITFILEREGDINCVGVIVREKD